MRLDVPAELFDRLQAAQRTQGGWTHADLPEPGAVWMHTDMGPSFFLTRDGRVLEVDPFDGDRLRELAPPETWPAIVAGAKTLACPDLLALLPPKPPGAPTCERCAGAHWGDLAADIREPHDPIIVVCIPCGGLGWIE